MRLTIATDHLLLIKPVLRVGTNDYSGGSLPLHPNPGKSRKYHFVSIRESNRKPALTQHLQHSTMEVDVITNEWIEL